MKNPEEAKRPVACSDLLVWLREQLVKFEHAVSARQQEESTWRSGTDKSWKAVGCKLTAKERITLANSHGRILLKHRRDLEMCKAAIVALSQPNNSYRNISEQTHGSFAGLLLDLVDLVEGKNFEEAEQRAEKIAQWSRLRRLAIAADGMGVLRSEGLR